MRENHFCHPIFEPGSTTPAVLAAERVHGLRVKPAMTCKELNSYFYM